MTISILGCGWLGFPLAQRLVREKITVKGSSKAHKKVCLLSQNSISGYQINLPGSFSDSSISDFWESDILFLNIPPSINGSGKNYPDIIGRAAGLFSASETPENKWVIFASSTSVYSDIGGFTTEKEEIKEASSKQAGNILFETENMIRKMDMDVTILRLAGLYGYGRHPVHYLSGKTGLGDPLKPVNLIHQVDCVNMITEVIKKNLRNEIFNLVSDGHPPRKPFYESAAKYYNLPLPKFIDEPEKNYRIISNDKIKDYLKYEFTYPNPMDHTP